jgi:hypothetical protein
MEDILEEILGEEIEDETDQQENVDSLHRNRDMDLARLRLLNSKMIDEKLSPSECAAVLAHLVANVPEVMAVCKENVKLVEALVENATVINLKRHSKDPTRPSPDDFLFRRQKLSNSCVLVLNGKMQILAGKDSFRSELGAWSVLGLDALSGEFVPDFSAYILSDSLRGIRFSTEAVTNIIAKEEGSLPHLFAHSVAERRSLSFHHK